jgi:uncharacterized protein (UPF0179 family)
MFSCFIAFGPVVEYVVEETAYLMAARPQREKQEGAKVTVSPSRACPKCPNFLPLGPTS